MDTKELGTKLCSRGQQQFSLPTDRRRESPISKHLKLLERMKYGPGFRWDTKEGFILLAKISSNYSTDRLAVGSRRSESAVTSLES
jgi:hypothetical protein